MKTWFYRTGSFLLLTVCLQVSSQEYVVDLTDVRLYTEAGILFGGAVEVLTTNGWERVCYDGFNLDIADFVCHMRGYEEGAMSVRPLASLGVIVNPTPSLTCQFNAEGNGGVQCQYSSTCSDHVALICNYPGYLGCYRHTKNSPVVDDAVFASSNLTVQSCLSHCRHADHVYAGVAFGQECYCESQELDESLRIGNRDCFSPCVGDPLQNCGGGTAAGIYDGRLGSCNEIYNDVEGAIASPGFPGKYTSNEHCTWTISVPDAVNITVHMRSVALYQGDQVKVSNPAMAEYVALIGGQSISNIQFHSSGRTFDASLLFTFAGNRIVIDFNSTSTSQGAQGVVLTFSSSLGPHIESSVPPDTTNATTNAEEAFSVGQTSPTSKPITTVQTNGYDSTTQSATSATVEGAIVTTVSDGAASGTPRLVTMVNEAPQTSPSIAVIVAIAVGIILLLLLIVTAVVLFTTSCKRTPSPKRRKKHNGAVTNAAYAIPNRNDGQTDSGIYDPGYDTADVEDPIYLSIRNDPRAHQLMRADSSGSYLSLDRNQSVKTTTTDHDYQSVRGVSRKNTERSYLSLYGDNKQSVFTLPRQLPSSEESTDTCKIAEDGYMIPTPKSSTQVKQTKL